MVLKDEIPNGSNTLIITGKYLISRLLQLNNDSIISPLINFARPVYKPRTNAGVVTSRGDIAMRSDVARTAFGVQGQGVKVGVISDSYNTIEGNPAASDVTNFDLPGEGNPTNSTAVQNLREPEGIGSDEGRAMLQIVHDIAPKATLAFRTGFISAGDFALGIEELKNAGCDIIVDDVTYITEPFFQDGVIAQAVDRVMAALDGIAYFTAAGNFGSKSYQQVFSAAPAPSRFP